jgi:hypothetical protein
MLVGNSFGFEAFEGDEPYDCPACHFGLEVQTVRVQFRSQIVRLFEGRGQARDTSTIGDSQIYLFVLVSQLSLDHVPRVRSGDEPMEPLWASPVPPLATAGVVAPPISRERSAPRRPFDGGINVHLAAQTMILPSLQKG